MKNKIVIVFLFCIVKVGAQTPSFSMVDSLFEKGRYQLALSELQKVKEPSFLSNYKTAIIYESIDNFKKTIVSLERALIFKADYKVKLKLAKAYQRIKQPNRAIEIYEEILSKDANNLVLKYQLGKLYLVTKTSKKAIAIFKYLQKIDIENANYSYQLGLGYAQLKKRNLMLNSFIATYKKDCTHFKAIVQLASNFNKLNDADSTSLFVNKGLGINANHITLNRLKINQLYREKKYKEALPFLLRIDSIQKKEVYTNSMLGKVYYNIGDFENAKTRFRNLSKIDEENFKSWTYLGHIALKEKNYKKANFYYLMGSVIGKKKRDEEYYGTASAYYETKKPKKAILNFEKAYKENYSNYKALYQLAKISDDYYKDKKIGYKHYVKYIERFESKDSDMTNFVKSRIKAIKKEYFLRVEKLE